MASQNQYFNCLPRRIKMKNLKIILCGLVLSFSSWAFAKTEVYTLDSVHSSIAFKIRHLVGRVTGSFPNFTGVINLDSADLTQSSVSAEIDVLGINTQNTKRDDHLKSPDFFDAGKFSKMIFKSTKIKKTESGKYQIEGDLTIHGIKKMMTLEMTYNGTSPGMMGEIRAGFSATGKINRKDYGIVWNKTLDVGGLALGDDVEITIEIEAVKEVAKASTPESAKAK